MISHRKAVILVPFPRKLASTVSILQYAQVSFDEEEGGFVTICPCLQ